MHVIIGIILTHSIQSVSLHIRYGDVWSDWHGQAVDAQEMFQLNDGAMIETIEGITF